MKAFELAEKTHLKLVKTTPHKEMHGDKLRQAVTLRVRMSLPGSDLAKIHKRLPDMFFYRDAANEAQDDVPGVPKIAPNILVPLCKPPFKLDYELSGYTVTIDHGTGGTSDLELYMCTLDRFEIVKLHEGGSAEIEWNVGSNKEITPALIGLLCEKEGTEIDLKQIAPALQAGQTIDGSVAAFEQDHPDAKKARKAKKDAEAAGQETLLTPEGALAASVAAQSAAEASKAALDASGNNPFPAAGKAMTNAQAKELGTSGKAAPKKAPAKKAPAKKSSGKARS